MNPEPSREPAPREVRIEGAALVVAGVALLAALSGAFYLGMRVGGSSAPAAENGSALSSTAPAQEAPPATATPGAFDRAAAGASEPEREVKTSPSPSPAAASPPEPAPGTYFVQVFAGRDRSAAESVKRSLEERGYPTRLDSQREGQDALYKVRVGGYRTEDEARLTAERLKKEGEKGAWVTAAH